MIQYTSRDDTPLYFHKILWFAALPLGITVKTVVSIMEICVIPNLDAYFFVSLILLSLTTFLKIVIFIGFFGWKPYSWYAMMIHSFIGIANSIIISFFTLQNINTENLSLGLERLGSIFLTCFVMLYYWKRKPLFFNTAQDKDTPSSGKS
jgi:hypothetical protein